MALQAATAGAAAGAIGRPRCCASSWPPWESSQILKTQDSNCAVCVLPTYYNTWHSRLHSVSCLMVSHGRRGAPHTGALGCLPLRGTHPVAAHAQPSSGEDEEGGVGNEEDAGGRSSSNTIRCSDSNFRSMASLCAFISSLISRCMPQFR